MVQSRLFCVPLINRCPMVHVCSDPAIFHYCMIHFSQLQNITQGKNIRFTKDWPVTTLLTDSRKAHGGEGGVFFAITGEHHDGHSYIHDLYQKGIRQFVVEREIPFFDGLDDVNILVVSSSLS